MRKRKEENSTEIWGTVVTERRTVLYVTYRTGKRRAVSSRCVVPFAAGYNYCY